MEYSEPSELRDCPQADDFRNRGSMKFNRLGGDVHHEADLLVRETFCKQMQDFALSLRQVRLPILPREPLMSSGPSDFSPQLWRDILIA